MARAKAAGFVEQWKQQLDAGQVLRLRDLELDIERSPDRKPQVPELHEPQPKGQPSTNDRERSGSFETLSDAGVLVRLVFIALACAGGYFLLMKLIDISRQEDCFLGGGTMCARPPVAARPLMR